MADDFIFLEPGPLIDGDLELCLVAKTRSFPRSVPVYNFEMRRWGNPRSMGRISLRISNIEHIAMYAGHIGYRVFPEFRGHRYAARSCLLLLPLARQHCIDPLWITCNPENIASRRTCEIIGATYAETVKLPRDNEMYKQGERLKRRYWI